MSNAAAALAFTDRAEAASRVLPPLLVEAERIAAAVILGDHGRKRAGPVHCSGGSSTPMAGTIDRPK